MRAGGTIASLRGISADQLEEYYAMGYLSATNGRLEDAERIFNFVVMHNHLDARTHKALGMVRHLLGAHALAANSYVAASVLDVMDPEPVVHLAECMLAMDQVESAAPTIDHATQRLARSPNQQLQQRIELLKESIAKKRAANKTETHQGEA